MSEDGLPLENFIQALTSQLDRAQQTMAMKARAGLPLTFAVKDLSLELRTHVGMEGAVVHIRPAGPGDTEASVLHLALTTITRPMIEENTPALDVEQGPSVKDVLGDDLSDDELRRLEWTGIRSVSQLRNVQRDSGADAIERVSSLPVDRLRMALAKASSPQVKHIAPTRDRDQQLLRVHGFNLKDGDDPEVRIGDEHATIVDANDRELLVRPATPVSSGVLEVRTGPGVVTAAPFSFEEDKEQ